MEVIPRTSIWVLGIVVGSWRWISRQPYRTRWSNSSSGYSRRQGVKSAVSDSVNGAYRRTCWVEMTSRVKKKCFTRAATGICPAFDAAEEKVFLTMLIWHMRVRRQSRLGPSALGRAITMVHFPHSHRHYYV